MLRDGDLMYMYTQVKVYDRYGKSQYKQFGLKSSQQIPSHLDKYCRNLELKEIQSVN